MYWKKQLVEIEALSDKELITRSKDLDDRMKSFVLQKPHDDQIVRCFRSGEMGNYFVLRRTTKLSEEYIYARLKEIRNDKEYHQKLVDYADDYIAINGERTNRAILRLVEKGKRND